MNTDVPDRPNILLIHSDQHRADTLGVNGHPMVQTPNLDALAASGVNFTRAYTPVPICSAARACLLTGAWSHTHKCLAIPRPAMFRPALEHLPVLTQMLHDAGYYVGWTGKFHCEVVGGPTDHGVDEYVPLGDYRKWREGEGIPPAPRDHKWFGDVDTPCPPEKGPLAWQADQVIRQMTQAKPGQPWLVRWDPVQPHLPCNPTQPFADMYPPDQIEPWPSFPDALENKPRVQQRQRRIWGIDNWPWEKFQPIVARYLAVISELDHNIGRVLAELEARGLADNTLVIYSTDHGDFCGGHGQLDKHFSMYDDITRVPLMLRWPGKIDKPGDDCDAFVSNELEMARTICSAAQIPVPETFVGQDLLELANGQAEARDDIFVQYFGTETGAYDSRMVTDARYKYVYNPVTFDELYDLEADPGEIVNRIDDPAMAQTLRRLRRRLVEWMQETDDPLWMGWLEVELLDGDGVSGKVGL